MAERRLPSAPRVGVVGATGMVGKELLSLLGERGFPIGSLRAFASPRRAGERVRACGCDMEVESLGPGVFERLDLAFFCAGKDLALLVARAAVSAGCLVIDSSQAFRLDSSVPLVVPEINARALDEHRGLVSNPNCSTIINALAAAPLARAFGLERMVVSTYQAASGAGAGGRDELFAGTAARLAGESHADAVFPEGLAFNAIPRIGTEGPDGFTEEERKMQAESRRILSHPELHVTTTCVRVPVERCHAVSTTLFLVRSPRLEEAREALAVAPGVVLESCPTPRGRTGRDAVAVGRLRLGPGSPKVLSYFAVGDQVRKGAALNAVQIAERLLPEAPPAPASR